jgi:hypothetical protein
MIEQDQFWDLDHYNHPQLTDDMVVYAERQLGVRLPVEYISLLRHQNGGYTKGFGYPMRQRTTWAEDHVPLNELFGIVTVPERNTALNILDTPYLTEEWELPPHQVLLSGDGHWWVTLDYRNGEVPSVAWIDVESDEDIQVAPTFADFINGLRPDAEFNEP